MEEQRVRISDIAQELGLSTATVSNVIHSQEMNIAFRQFPCAALMNG